MDPNKWTGGVWTREAAGRRPRNPRLPTASAAPSQLQVKTNFSAYQVGLDTGLLNLGNSVWNAHVGVMAGSVSANAIEQLGSGTSLKFDVPFAGFYGVLTRGAFFSDITLRRDWHNDTVSNSLANLYNASLTGSTNAVNASAGYHLDLPMLAQGFFVEPSVGGSISKTNMNNLPTNLNEPGVPAGLIGFNTLTSEVVRAGVRVGTSATINDVLVVQPFTTLSAWRELAGVSQEQFSQLELVV